MTEASSWSTARPLRDLFDQSLDIEFLTSLPKQSFLGQARALVGEQFVRPLPENSVDHAQAVLLIGQLEAAYALSNQRVRELFPELSVEDGPFENQFSAKFLEWRSCLTSPMLSRFCRSSASPTCSIDQRLR